MLFSFLACFSSKEMDKRTVTYAETSYCGLIVNKDFLFLQNDHKLSVKLNCILLEHIQLFCFLSTAYTDTLKNENLVFNFILVINKSLLKIVSLNKS